MMVYNTFKKILPILNFKYLLIFIDKYKMEIKRIEVSIIVTKIADCYKKLGDINTAKALFQKILGCI